MDDNRKKLYDALSGEYDMGTYDQFCKDIQDSGKRKRLYDATSKEYDYGTYDSFSKQLGLTSLLHHTLRSQCRNLLTQRRSLVRRVAHA